jgi:hypothetical protein
MTVNDVDLIMQPSAARVGFATQPSIADKRLTFQHFNTHDLIVQTVAPHNSDARRSVGDGWPPPLIFDVAYGCAALKTWGVAAFTVFARNHTNDIYYDNGGNGDDHGGGGRGGRSVRGRGTKLGRQASDIAHSQSPDFADMILGLWMHDVRKNQHKVHAMKADRTREKVQTWLVSAEQSTTMPTPSPPPRATARGVERD